jgi:hypothetical protein
MTNPFETPNEITEEVVIEALNSKGVENTEAAELLAKYANQCQAEANAEAAGSPEDPLVSNRANIKADIKMAQLYAKTANYKHMAAASLQDTLLAASQDTATQDLAEEIETLLNELSK